MPMRRFQQHMGISLGIQSKSQGTLAFHQKTINVLAMPLDEHKFKADLANATNHIIRMVTAFCCNRVNGARVVYTIKPTALHPEEDWEDFEKNQLRTQLAEIGQNFEFKEVVEKLFVNGHCPKWINISVELLTKDSTMLLLEPSPRYGVDSAELYNDKGFGPFNTGILTPPWAKEVSKF